LSSPSDSELNPIERPAKFDLSPVLSDPS